MAWSATDNFNNYANGNLVSNNGGSGWAGAWTAGAGTGPQVQATTVKEGAKAVSLSEADASSYRDLSVGVTAGIVYVAIRKSSVAALSITMAFTLRKGATDEARILWAADGNIQLVGATTVDLVVTTNANQWYAIRVEIDQAGARFRASVDGGAYSSYVADIGSNGYTDIDRIALAQASSTTGTAFWDDIGGPTAATTVSDDLSGYGLF